MATFFGRRKPPPSPETVAALNPAAAPNMKASRNQQILLAGGAGIVVVVAGYFLVSSKRTGEPSSGAASDLQPTLAVSDTVNRNVTQGEWIARSEAELRDMQARMSLLEKQAASSVNNTTAETARLRRELERDREDGKRVMSAYEQENAKLRRELQQARAGGANAVPTPATPPVARGVPPRPPGLADPFRVDGAGVASPAGVPRGATGAAMPPGIPQVRTISFLPQDKVASGPGVTRTGFQATAPEAPPTAMEASADYLPPNSYAPATVIVGVDASTGVSSQSDPLPVLLRITGPARSVVSNGKVLTTRLEGCIVNGAARGDLSSEKVYVKLVRMTCDQPGGRVAVSDVKGFISFAGKTGVRGNVVSREGDLVTKAFLAGIAGGFGRAFSANSQLALRPGSTVISGTEDGAAIPQLTPQQILAGGMGEGLGTAGDMLGQYLIERAEQYQPVIEMPTGIEVHVVFLDGVYVRGGRQ